MTLNSLTRNELDELTRNINSFKEYVDSYCEKQNIQLSQSAKSFLRFWAKRIIFMNYLKECDYNQWIDGIVSDMFFFSASVILDQKRYMYLNLRSFIESFIKLLLNVKIENEQITRKSFEQFRSLYKKDILNDDEFSIIKNVYKVSCMAIHNPLFKENDLAIGIKDCLENKIYNVNHNNHRNTVETEVFNNVQTITSIFIRLLIYKYREQIDSTFYRRKIIMNRLIGNTK